MDSSPPHPLPPPAVEGMASGPQATPTPYRISIPQWLSSRVRSALAFVLTTLVWRVFRIITILFCCSILIWWICLAFYHFIIGTWTCSVVAGFLTSSSDSLLKKSSVACSLSSWTLTFAPYGSLMPSLRQLSAKTHLSMAHSEVPLLAAKDFSSSTASASDEDAALEHCLEVLDDAFAQLSQDVEEEKRRSRELWEEIYHVFEGGEEKDILSSAARLICSRTTPFFCPTRELHIELFVMEINGLLDSVVGSRKMLLEALDQAGGGETLDKTFDTVQSWQGLWSDEERRLTGLRTRELRAPAPNPQVLKRLSEELKETKRWGATARVATGGMRHVEDIRHDFARKLKRSVLAYDRMRDRALKINEELGKGVNPQILAQRLRNIIEDVDRETHGSLKMFTDPSQKI